MKRNLLVLTCLVLGVVFFASQSWAQCPEDPNDNGVCDTLYIEIWPEDDWVEGFPSFVRFPIRVTNDIPDPLIDSIAGMVIPLAFTSSNAAANAVIPAAKNNTNVYPFSDLENSIFRHMPSMDTLTATDRNFLMDISYGFLTWATRELVLDGGTHFWMSLIPSGSPNPRFPGGSRVLTATMTFTIVDTTTICIDTCFWPPTGRLAFQRSDAVTYFPRHFLPMCQVIRIFCNMPPQFYSGVGDQWHHPYVGHYATGDFTVGHECGIMTAVSANFVGEGVENVTVVLHWGLPAVLVEGHVEYDVVDTCLSGGTVTIIAESNNGTAYHDFAIHLPNDPPHLILSDTWRALAGYTMVLEVTGVDPDGDIMGDIELEAVWYLPDSLQAPTNPPSYEPGNPGHLTWALAEADTGVWICVFSLSDSCGAEGLDTLAIGVSLPFCGDCTGDGEINVGDVVCLINYLYRQGTPPEPLCRGDATGDGTIDVADVIVMVNYLFRGSWSPCFDCCDGG